MLVVHASDHTLLPKVILLEDLWVRNLDLGLHPGGSTMIFLPNLLAAEIGTLQVPSKCFAQATRSHETIVLHSPKELAACHLREVV